MKDTGFDEPEQSFDWAENVHAWVFRAKVLLRKYWWIFILTIALGLGYQAREELTREPRYTSVARMIVSGRIALPDGGVYREELSNFFGTESYVMRGPTVRERAMDRVRAFQPDLKPVAVNLHAGQQPETSIFVLTAEGGEPKFVQAYLDAVLDEYINLKNETRQSASDRALLKIQDELLGLEEEIERHEQALVEFQKKNNLVFLDKQGASTTSYLVESKNQLDSLKSQLRALDSLSLEQHLETPLEMMSGDLRNNILQVSGSYRETKKELDRLRAERDEFSIYMKPKHPRIIGLNQEIERTGNLLDIYQDQGLSKVREQRELLRVQIRNLEAEVADLEVTALDFSRRQAEYDRLKAQSERANNLYDRLLGTIQTIDVSENLGQETVAILEKAGPAYPVRVNLVNNLRNGGMAGLALGAGLIFLLGVLDNRVVSGEDLSRRFDHPVLGIIPLEPVAADGRVELLKPKDPRHLFAEACRTLRSSLLFMDREGPPPRSFIVTSAVPAEGKSTISTNLAITLAFTSSKTILVDADLRRGFLHKHLLRDNSKGLSELIRGEYDLDDVIQQSDVENLDFISCGAYPERPGELLLSARMDQLYQDLLSRYEYVIFDTAPVLATDDTPSFATKVDAVLFTVRSGYTQARQVRSSVERLKQRGANLSGFILNFVDTKGSDYYYYNKYQNYYYAESDKSSAAQAQ